MSSNIQVQRICQHCNNEFTARTTTTLYCSKRCNSAAYKAKIRSTKIELSNTDTKRIRTQPIEKVKAKEFLTVKDVSTLLNISLRTAYRLIEQGTIKAVNLSERKTLVKRSEIDKLFELPTIEKQPEPTFKTGKEIETSSEIDINECYNLTEIQTIYGISEKALYELIKRNNIPKTKKGWFSYVPKSTIDRHLRKPE